MYCVIVGDIVGSRTNTEGFLEEDREGIDQILNGINAEYLGDILSEFRIVRGDALEGILYSEIMAPEITRKIIQRFWSSCKLQLRLCVAVDELYCFHLDCNKADGPAFYRAVSEIKEIKETGDHNWFQIRFSNKSDIQPVLNGITTLMEAVSRNWTEKQKEIVFLMPDMNNRQVDVAAKLKIPPSTVNKQLKATAYDSYHNAWLSLEQYFESALVSRINQDEDQNSFTEKYSYGRLLSKNGDLDEAKSMFEEACIEAEKAFGAGDARTLPFLNGMIDNQIRRQKVSPADDTENWKNHMESLFERAYECQKVWEKTLEYMRTDLLEGDYYQVVKNYEAAKQCYSEAEERVIRIYGNRHPLIEEVRNKRNLLSV